MLLKWQVSMLLKWQVSMILKWQVSMILAPAVRRNLIASGHSGRAFAPYLARIIGPGAVAGGAPSGVPLRGEGWLSPMIELRRLLHEAREARWQRGGGG